ncbi:hypothetical protein TraAM80_07185 [Trypanosoma rangeli]|uniref:Uncharacterized protein n=1 Tax=Trypanosoma rangeli TaxID=5698 RepID=A0A422N6N6_TRYRA|nr:uncharacterized protein TraAM80_07185 [Trypanosoma rangeli]RNF01133.1 hypothetical protein TraAM80_07185 [Trypanosoma rangeli]|eukprot:RNF01133.1 hypothetical protein TraAM80_07185 [Trypanosoma rangeli]
MCTLNPSLLLLGSSSDLKNFPSGFCQGSNSFSAAFLAGEDDARGNGSTLFGCPAEMEMSASLQPSTTEAVARLMQQLVGGDNNRKSKDFLVRVATPPQAAEALRFSSAADAGKQQDKPTLQLSGKEPMKTEARSAVRPRRGMWAATTPVSRQHSAKGPVPTRVSITQKQQQQQQQQQQPRSLSHETRSSGVNTGGELPVTSKSRTTSLKQRYFARGRSRRSFIEGITFCDDDTWQPSSGVGRATRKKPATKVVPELKPLPRQMVRQLYTEGPTSFAGRGFASSPSSPLPRKLCLAGVGSSWDSMEGVETHGGAPNPRALPHSQRDGSIGVSSRALKVQRISSHSLHTWNEPPSNVVLPNGTMPSQEKPEETEEVACDIWRAASEHVRDDNEKGGWMRPLQETGRSKRRSVHDPGFTVKSYSRGLDDDAVGDDDYHAFFHSLQRLQPRHHRLIDVLKESTARTASGTLRGFTNSFAACSALLNEPQHLLDSEFLGSPSAATSLYSGNTGQVASFALGRSGIPLFQTPEQRPQFVDMSYPAKVLYAAVLYLRALGGFPTLLRVTPLSKDSGVVGKEHCVELVFHSLLVSKGHQGRRSDPPQTTRLHYSRTFSSIVAAQQKSGESSQRTRADWEERTVIVRSILAEKSVVQRFGKAEVVHVLPPIESWTASPVVDADNTTGEEFLEAKSAAVRHFLNDAEPRHGSTVRSQAAHRATYTRGVGRGRRSKYVDCGDLAVAFLISGGLSKLSDVPPEPMDLEALRYKVYALRHHELDDATRKGVRTAGPQHVARQQRLRWSSVGLSLVTGEGQTPSPLSKESTASKTSVGPPRTEGAKLESMQRQFPTYMPVTVAESTLAATTDGDTAVCGGDPQTGAYRGPHFSQLRLPRLYTDIVDAVQYALDVQDRLENESVTRARFL